MSDDTMSESRMTDKQLHTYLLGIARTFNIIKEQNKDLEIGMARSGFILCPMCDNKLHWVITPKKHLLAICDTKGCVSISDLDISNNPIIKSYTK